MSTQCCPRHVRRGVIATVALSRAVSALRDLLQATDGTLGAHVRKLEAG